MLQQYVDEDALMYNETTFQVCRANIYKEYLITICIGSAAFVFARAGEGKCEFRGIVVYPSSSLKER